MADFLGLQEIGRQLDDCRDASMNARGIALAMVVILTHGQTLDCDQGGRQSKLGRQQGGKKWLCKE